jgi:hypothetical protein
MKRLQRNSGAARIVPFASTAVVAGTVLAMAAAAALVVVLMMPRAARAQGMGQGTAGDTANPVSTSLRASLTRYARLMPAAADAMPADKYGYHPMPEQLSFGHFIMHIAQSNVGLCAAISGTPPADLGQLADTDPKDKLLGAIKASFDYCTTALANVDDSKLGEQVKIGQRSMTRAQAVLTLAIDWADHYSTQADYLRMNGILPPSAQPRPNQPAKQP